MGELSNSGLGPCRGLVLLTESVDLFPACATFSELTASPDTTPRLGEILQLWDFQPQQSTLGKSRIRGPVR
jgi:hypothetical protein